MSGPMEIRGHTRVEYFHVECDSCGHFIVLSELRWVGGVPEIKAECEGCRRKSSFKLHPLTWGEIVGEP